MSIQDFLKSKIDEAGITQREVAKRIGWTAQNVNYKLNRPNARFCSTLIVAEGIGLSCKIRPLNEATAPIDTEKMIDQACKMDITAEVFQEMLGALDHEMYFDWRQPGDKIYLLDAHENELKNHNG
ncbi:MAG: hypothetical protein LIO54_08320 [Oscillospiraceae bacterium]|nr:hypothetical protein [Oscillospiraceae bacterium]